MLKTPKIRKSLLLVVTNEVTPAVKYVAPSRVSRIRLHPKRWTFIHSPKRSTAAAVGNIWVTWRALHHIFARRKAASIFSGRVNRFGLEQLH